ncbi:MAG: histidine--tRNA ligase [Actinobacteria bacterium]|nr:histidine--tRNA ligase [Actinomycetota bacterium]
MSTGEQGGGKTRARFQAPSGTEDVFGDEAARFERLVTLFAGIVERAGFGLIVGPMFEDLAVYERVGESTDIVRKEMYDFTDKGGRALALRPDSTPSVVRAFIEHRPATPWKVWYLNPHFRYDRPQRGRLRQHHSLGIEVIGSADADLDAEVISLAWSFLTAVGFGPSHMKLSVNSIGDDACRPAYRAALLDFLDSRADELCDEHRERRADNPMRVLDCKRESCRGVTADAPVITDHLCDECADHFGRVRSGLDALSVEYSVNPRLVRGQDYYTRTAFEVEATSVTSAQNALGGGGRYDGFAEAMGGPPTPAIGFGLGVDRILLAAGDARLFAAPANELDAFVIDTTGGMEALRLVEELRTEGLSADRAYDQRSMKAQFRAADKSGARLALVVGPDEAAAGTVTVKALRGPGDDETVPRDQVTRRVRGDG